MLVNFYIDPAAIDDDINRSHINALRNRWQQFGVLTHPSHNDGALRELRRSRFPSLKQENRRLWNALWQEIENSPNRFLRCRGNYKIVLISTQLAGNENIPDAGSKYVRGVETVRLTQVNDSKEFIHVENLSRRRISIGDRAADLWQERFQELARHSRDVAVVDQWAVRSNRNIGGLSRLLRLLNRDSNGCSITIYSSPNSGSRSELRKIQRMVSTEAVKFDRSSINSIEIRLFEKGDFNKFAYDRHIRFDHRVIEIGRGLRIFELNSVQENSRISFNILTSGAAEDTESDLSNGARNIINIPIPIGPPPLIV